MSSTGGNSADSSSSTNQSSGYTWGSGRSNYYGGKYTEATLPVIGVVTGLFVIGAAWYFYNYKRQQKRLKDPNYLPSYFESNQLRSLALQNERNAQRRNRQRAQSSPLPNTSSTTTTTTNNTTSSSSSSSSSTSQTTTTPPPDYSLDTSRTAANHIPAWMLAQMGVRIVRDEIDGSITLLTVEDNDGVLEIAVERNTPPSSSISSSSPLSESPNSIQNTLPGSPPSSIPSVLASSLPSSVSTLDSVMRESTPVPVVRVDGPKVILTNGQRSEGEAGNRESWGPPPQYQNDSQNG
ncbi:hypothetical protein HK097_000223 [Rhizophlyctis rosea]|uniref:Uncharacterized protein n=1 Tax=Rhizophlyctis rosea TaxID=64517 RepID=A0AAD5S8C9_9FUNG|nr:hypothetical protein HK097_000223 [Rhizophlyctis rosea]